jgi:hypothetical protein
MSTVVIAKNSLPTMKLCLANASAKPQPKQPQMKTQVIPDLTIKQLRNEIDLLADLISIGKDVTYSHACYWHPVLDMPLYNLIIIYNEN